MLQESNTNYYIRWGKKIKLNSFLRTICKKNYSHRCIIEKIQDHCLHQHVEQVTQRSGNDNQSLINLVFIDEEMQVSEFAQHPPLGNNDQYYYLTVIWTTQRQKKYILLPGYNVMRNHLANCDWAHEYTELAKLRTVKEILDLMKSELLYLRNQFTPRPTISG